MKGCDWRDEMEEGRLHAVLQDHSLTYGPRPAGSMTSLSFACRPGFVTVPNQERI